MNWLEVPKWVKDQLGPDCWIPTTHHPDDYNDLHDWIIRHHDVPPEIF
jgi:hypothetical protein